MACVLTGPLPQLLLGVTVQVPEVVHDAWRRPLSQRFQPDTGGYAFPPDRLGGKRYGTRQDQG